MHEFFKAYAQQFDVLRRIDFETEVLEITRLEETQGWNVRVQTPSGEETMQTKKLIIATGVTNRPHKPPIDGAEHFDGPIIHSAELGKQSGTIVKDPQISTVTVLGGGKSAYDAVYLAAMAGKDVAWIVRKSGKGPSWVFPSHVQIGPIRAWREVCSFSPSMSLELISCQKLPLRRILSCFSPWFWEDGLSWLRNFLHAGFGKKITQAFWNDVHHTSLKQCLYAEEKPLNVLEPEQSPFWYGTHSGVYNFSPDLFDFIRKGKVRVYREDVSRLSSHSVHLADGQILHADALITATGFTVKPTYDFSPSTLHSDLGIPTTGYTQAQRDFWSHLNHKAELTIVSKFPRLLLGPFKSPSSNVIQPYNPGIDPELQHTPFRLYRAIAPPGLTVQGDRSLVFIGMFSNISAFIRLELQCLWACAYLNGQMPIDTNTVFEETALFSRYARYRSPYGHGRFFPDLVFDQVPYFDVLMQDLGLPYWRKKNLLQELFSSYGPADYKGVIQEWKRAQGTKRLSEKASNGGWPGNGWEHVDANEKTRLLHEADGKKGHRSTGSSGV